MDSVPELRLRYTKTTRLWSLYWRDRNLRWHEYLDLAPDQSIETLLEEVGSHRNPIFWG